MADASPGLPEIRRDLGRIEKRQDEHEREVRESYVRRDVYVAERDADRARLARLETEGSTRETGNRVWLLGLAQIAFGAVLSLLGAYLLTKGH